MKPNKITFILFRIAGLSAMLSGLLFILIQLIHPADILSSVTTSRWAIVHYMSIVMCLLGMLGITGLYFRQMEEAGWMGLVGYLLFSLFYAVTMAFTFAEAFISPQLAAESPKFVESLLAIPSGATGEMKLEDLRTVYSLTGGLYLFGSLLFGIALFRARAFPRWAAGLLASGGPASAIIVLLLPHPLDRIAAVPLGLGLAWMGFVLLSSSPKIQSNY